jgi:hypothetical protein
MGVSECASLRVGVKILQRRACEIFGYHALVCAYACLRIALRAVLRGEIVGTLPWGNCGDFNVGKSSGSIFNLMHQSILLKSLGGCACYTSPLGVGRLSDFITGQFAHSPDILIILIQKL